MATRYLSDPRRDSLGYPYVWLSYHPALVEVLHPNVMDASNNRTEVRCPDVQLLTRSDFRKSEEMIMEPLGDAFRKFYRQQHPEVDEGDLDRLEALLAQRFMLDPTQEANEIQRLDAERERLLQERLPDLQRVWEQFQLMERERRRRRRR